MTLKLAQLSLLCPVCGAEVPPVGRRGPVGPTARRRVNRPPIGAALAGHRRTYLDRDRLDGGEPWWSDRECRWRFQPIPLLSVG
jgi:hypothetical protein